jgi:hypothetical protein
MNDNYPDMSPREYYDNIHGEPIEDEDAKARADDAYLDEWKQGDRDDV